MRVAQYLKQLIKERGIKQSQMASEIGLATSSMSDILSGRFVGREGTIKDIIKYLHLTKDEELEVWKMWTLDRGEERASKYFEKLDKENQKLKKILKTIKELWGRINEL